MWPFTTDTTLPESRGRKSWNPRRYYIAVELGFAAYHRTTQSTAATKKPMDIIESSKRLAAYTAVDNHIKPEHKVSEMFIGWVITPTVGPNRSLGSVLVRSKTL